MADTVRGKLVWQGTGDKRVRRVIFPTKKGMSIPTPFDPEQLAALLHNRTEEEIEVDLEVVRGKPVRIRPLGEPFAAASITHPASSYQQERGTPYRGQQGRGPQGQRQPQQRSSPIHGAFHNPYNFVPALPRDGVNGELGDHAPIGHHVFHPDRYTGVIRVKMTVKTPLLVPDAASLVECPNDHKSFPLRIDAEGNPYIPPTSIKGMLRAAYEAVTNSRLAVFPGREATISQNATGHGMRLAFRRPARVEVVPARIEARDDQQLIVRILSQVWLKSAAKLPRYIQRPTPGQRVRKGEAGVALRYPDRSLPQHGDHVRVMVDAKGRVTRIVRYDGSTISDGFEGWVLITEPNIGNKKYERVYVVSNQDQFLPLKQNESLLIRQMWNELISNYRQTHVKDLAQREKKNHEPTDYLGDSPGQTAWSRQVWDDHYTQLRDGTLCYVRLNGKNITGIYPVSISRDLYPVSPLSLLHPKLHPATSLSQLSPADRVFGWVNQQGKGAYQGNVRIGPVSCKTNNAIESFGSPGLPLAILGQPKPQQARFYVAASQNGEAQANGRTKEQAGYSPGKGLRGRKVYPHHCMFQEQEYRRPRLNGQEQRDNQNRSIQGWVKPHTEFIFDLHVTNLSQVELGALLWLLDLDHVMNAGKSHEERKDYYHRFGGAKPLGFGSVQLKIESSQLLNGSGWKQFYSTFDDFSSDELDRDIIISKFQEAVRNAYGSRESFENIHFISAWLRMAQGFADNLPIHYPRVSVQPDPAGENFRWFTENERQNSVSLGNLQTDPGLPLPTAT